MFRLFVKVVLIFVVFCVTSVCSWGSSDSVKLKDVNVLTLYHGRTTTFRRTSPVPQLKCIGGTAGCSAFAPQVVQCINKGSDGHDVQWECKTDMDNAYRFGRIEVVCEGYDYPEDEYILKGSCGLEYTLDLTKEGYQKQKGGDHNYYGDSFSTKPSYGSPQYGSPMGNVIFIIIIVIVIYALYRTCIVNQSEYQYSTTNDDYPGSDYPRGTPYGYGSSQPPPPGFRHAYPPGDGCSGNSGSRYGSAGSGGGGFWTGAGVGGLLGYMFGNRNNAGYGTGYGTGYNSYRPSAPAAPSFNASSGFGGGGFGGSSGTRTASGFGGTRRR